MQLLVGTRGGLMDQLQQETLREDDGRMSDGDSFAAGRYILSDSPRLGTSAFTSTTAWQEGHVIYERERDA